MRLGKPLWVSILVMAVLTGSLATGCTVAPSGEHDLPMAALENMPVEVQHAAVPVQQAYQYAVANPDTLRQIPCYCGCGSMGHTSNYACYISGTDASGRPAFDHHALGCSICVDITLDVMRLEKQGKSVSEIRSYVDATYAQYGPSNIP